MGQHDGNAITPKKKRGPFMSTLMGDPVDISGLRAAAKANPRDFHEKACKLVDSGALDFRAISQSRGGLAGFLSATLDIPVTAYARLAGEERAIQTSAFTLLTGAMTVAGINAAYEQLPTVGQDLVTDVDDNKKFSTFASIVGLDHAGTDSVPEGEDFPEIGAGEEKYTIGHKRNGRRLSLTAEMFEENDFPEVTRRVNALGEIAGKSVEKQTLRRIFDIDGSGTTPAEPYVLHRNGVGAALYSATANTPSVQTPNGTRYTNNALVDSTDLDNARTRLASVKDGFGNRILVPVSRCTLVVPDALVGVAQKILGSELEPGIENELNNWGPRGSYRPRLRSSPMIDDLTTTAWLFGWMEQQFFRKWKLRFDIMSLGADTESMLRSRIAFQASIAWDVEVGAVDHVYVVQSLAGTTAP